MDTACPAEPVHLAKDIVSSAKSIQSAADKLSTSEAIRPAGISSSETNRSVDDRISPPKGAMGLAGSSSAETIRLAKDRVPSNETIPSAAGSSLVVAMQMPAVTQTPVTARHKPVERRVLGEEDWRGCEKTPEVTQPQRLPTNNCGHASSSGSSPKAVGRLPAHGEGVLSTNSAVPSTSNVASGFSHTAVDCCLASNPSVAPPNHSSDQPTNKVHPPTSGKADVIQSDSSAISAYSLSTENISEDLTREGC